MALPVSQAVDAVIAWANRYISFIILALIVLVLLYLWVRVPRGLPPCPKWVWPGFAHSLMVKGDLTHLFVRLRAEHGDVFSLWIGGRLVIVINGFQKIKEAFIEDGANFAWRPDILNCDLFHYGVICTSGRQWREQRRVTTAALDHLQQQGLTVMMKEEVGMFLAAVEGQGGGAWDPKVLLQSAVCSLLSGVIFGQKLDYSDPRLCEAVSHFNDNIKLYSDCRLPNFFPYEKFLIGDTFDTKFLRLNMADIHTKLIMPEVAQRQGGDEEEGRGDTREDFLTLYRAAILRQQAEDSKQKEQVQAAGKKESKKEQPTTVNKMNMQASVYDILWHGTVSLAGALQWALLYLLHNPHVQARAHEEIDGNFTAGSSPHTAEDRSKLPYLEAVVYEVFRLGRVLPFGMARAVLKEVKFHGFRIPTNAVVVPNLDSVLMSPKVFSEPDNFQPERFISKITGQASCPAQYIPFFFGVRTCLGERMAKDAMFHFLFGILQNYQLQPEEAGKLPPLTRGFQVVSLPKDFKLRFVRRTS